MREYVVQRVRALAAATILVALVAVAGVVPIARAASGTPSRLADNQYDGGVYTADYQFDDYLASSAGGLAEYNDWLANHVTGGRTVPVASSFACTYIMARGGNGHWLIGRNMDWSGVTPSIRVETHPAGGYASIGNALVMKANAKAQPTASDLSLSALTSPYYTADGINEKGVSVAILELDGFNPPRKAGAKTISQFAMTRLVLDHADSVKTAENLLESYNIAPLASGVKTGLHLAVSDRTGDMAVFEWQEGTLHVTRPAEGERIVTNTATWSGAVKKDSRYNKARNYLIEANAANATTADNLLSIMDAVPSQGKRSLQWSTVYDLTDLTAIQNAYGNDSSRTSFRLGGTPTPTPPSTVTHTVTYDVNGGTGTIPASKTGADGSIILSDGGKLTYAGYSFAGWNTKPDGTGTAYKAGDRLTPDADITLYAQWTKADTATMRTVRYHANGGRLAYAGISEEMRVPDGSATNGLQRYTWDGHVFTGWNTRADGKGTAYAIDSHIAVHADIDLYAQWLDLSDTTPITTVGTVHIQDILNMDGTSARTNGLKDNSGYFAKVNVILSGTLTTPGDLKEGTLLRIPWSTSKDSHYILSSPSCPSVIDDGVGANDLAVVSCDASGMTLRVDSGLRGVSRYSWSASIGDQWSENTVNKTVKTVKETTLTVGGDAVTVTGTPMTAYDFTNKVDAIQQTHGMGWAVSKSSARVAGWVKAAAITEKVADDARKDIVIVQHVTPTNGSGITAITPVSQTGAPMYLSDWKSTDWITTVHWAVDRTQVDASADSISTPDAASRTLKANQWAAARLGDGSWYVAVNLGPAAGGATIPDDVRTGDAETDALIDKARTLGFATTSDLTMLWAVEFADASKATATVTYDNNLGLKRLNKSPYVLHGANADSEASAVRLGSVSYDPNCSDVTGDMEPQTGELGETTTVAENAYSRPGHTFAGWNTRADGTGRTVKPGDGITYTNPGTVLYAQWQQVMTTMAETGGRSLFVVLAMGASLFLAGIGVFFTLIRRRNRMQA